MLLVLALLQLVLMLASIVLPIPNGVFMPIFLLGASTGRLFGEALQYAFGLTDSELPSAVMSVVGAASLTAGTTHTLSTALIALELTTQQSLLNPVLIGVLCAFGVSGLLSRSIYDQILVLKVERARGTHACMHVT